MDGMPAGVSALGFPLPTLPSAEVTAWPLTTGASWLRQLFHSQTLSHIRGDFIPKVLLAKEHCDSSILSGLINNSSLLANGMVITVARALLGNWEVATECSQTKSKTC